MIGELCELLRRQIAAVSTLESRLRAMELIVAADEQRFVALALEECESASQQLAALELTRALALSTAGFEADTTANRLIGTVEDADDAGELRRIVDELRDAATRLAGARDRATAVVSRAARHTRVRVEAATVFADAY